MKVPRHWIRERVNSAKWWAVIAAAVLVFHHPQGWLAAIPLAAAVGFVGWLLSITIGAWWVETSSRRRAKAFVHRLHRTGVLPPRNPKGSQP
jgi:hypothetical protein